MFLLSPLCFRGRFYFNSLFRADFSRECHAGTARAMRSS
jgi:hypothetical protein